jgi:hypothetical protein
MDRCSHRAASGNFVLKDQRGFVFYVTHDKTLLHILIALAPFVDNRHGEVQVFGNASDAFGTASIGGDNDG